MRIFFAALIGACMAQSAYADSTLSIEVNAAQSTDSGCNLSFLVQNDLPQDVKSAVYEAVLLDNAGQVFQLSLFDFGHLPASKPRVRQFLLGNTTCDSIGHILFNGATTCEGEGLAPKVCETNLSLSTRTKIEVSG